MRELDCRRRIRVWVVKSFALAMTRLQAAAYLPAVIASPMGFVYWYVYGRSNPVGFV